MIIHIEVPDGCKRVHLATVSINEIEDKCQILSGAWSITPVDGKHYKIGELKEDDNDRS